MLRVKREDFIIWRGGDVRRATARTVDLHVSMLSNHTPM